MEVKSDPDMSMESSSTAFMDELEVECIEAIELMCLVPSIFFTFLCQSIIYERNLAPNLLENSGRRKTDFYDTDPDYDWGEMNDLKRKSRPYEKESAVCSFVHSFIHSYEIVLTF